MKSRLGSGLFVGVLGLGLEPHVLSLVVGKVVVRSSQPTLHQFTIPPTFDTNGRIPPV